MSLKNNDDWVAIKNLSPACSLRVVNHVWENSFAKMNPLIIIKFATPQRYALHNKLKSKL